MSKPVCIIIPTLNERDNIAPLVKRIDRALSDYEIVFIDDDSRDGTAGQIMSLSGDYPVTVIIRKNKRGLASAVVHGLEHTDSEIIGVVDADLQHPPEVLPRLLQEIKSGADIAIASRYVKGGGCRGWGPARRILSRGAMFLAHLLLPPTRQVKDPMSGFFMFRRHIITDRLRPTGYKILLEILMEGHAVSTAEVPYTFEARSGGKSKLSIRQQVEYIGHLYSLMRRKGELLRFARFCLVGASGVSVNEGLLFLLRQFASLPLWLASAISIEASIVSNYTLNDYFTFRDRRMPGGQSFLKRLGKFNVISLAGLGINLAVLLILTAIFGEQHYLLFNLAGIAVAMVWNFTANSWWTWR